MKYIFTPLIALMSITQISQAASIVVQAEDYTSVSSGETFTTFSDANAANGEYIVTLDATATNATVTYSLSIPTTDQYTLYIRVLAANGADDSFLAPTQSEFDTASATPTQKINNLHDGNSTSYRWVNTNAGTYPEETGTTDGTAPKYNFTAGTSNFTLRGRENGLRIDALVFDTDDSITSISTLNTLAGVPEPSSIALLSMGCFALLVRQRK